MPDCREKITQEMGKKGLLTRAAVDMMFHRAEQRVLHGNWSKGKMKPEEYKAFIDRINAMPLSNRIREAFSWEFVKMVHEKEEAYRKNLIQAQVNARNLQYIVENGKRNAKAGNVKAVIEMMVGDSRGRQSEMSLEALKNGNLQVNMSELVESMDHYLKAFGFRLTDEQGLNIAREMDNPGSTGDHAAAKLVEDFHRLADRSRLRKNDLGADIGYLKDWNIQQVWSPADVRTFGLSRSEKLKLMNPFTPLDEKRLMYKQARDNFIATAFPLMDRSFYRNDDGKPYTDKQMTYMLMHAYESISTRGLNELGEVIAERTEQNELQPVPIFGVKSLAVKVGHQRELHFDSAEHWYDFNKKLGRFDLLGLMQQWVMKDARDTALLETFGPNPDGGFKALLTEAAVRDAAAAETLRVDEYNRLPPGTEPIDIPPSANKQNDKVQWAKHIFAELSASSHAPVSEGGEIVSRYFQGLRNWMVAAKLGSVLLSQVNDTATYAAIARSDGLGIGKAIEFAAKALNPASGEDRKIAMQLGIATNTMINEVSMRYGEATKGVTMSSRFANATVRLSGMEWWTDGMKRGFQMLVGFELNNAIVKGRESMGPQFNRMLERYGIGDKEWELISQAQPVKISGQDMITPVSIKLMGDTPLHRDTAIKVAGMMAQEADIAIVSPGAADMAFVRRSTQPGTMWGEAARTFGLFKTFSISLTRKVLPRVFGVEGTNSFRAGLGAQFALSMILAGGISYQLKSLAFGKNPRDMTSPEFWMASAAQSGGLGIFGDYLFADYNRFGHDVPSAVFGPIGGLTSDIAKLTVGNVRQAMQGEDTHTAAEAMQFVKNYTPGINLWYSRAALDHLLFFTVQEAANPGYLRRMKSRSQAENKQSFWWDPQDKLPTEGPDWNEAIGK